MDDSLYEFEPFFSNEVHYAPAVPFYVTYLFINGLISRSVISESIIGQALIWNDNTTTALGSTSFVDHDIREIVIFGDHDIAGFCCEACGDDFPDTIMFNYDKELSKCFCLKASPGKTPTTRAPYILGDCAWLRTGTPLGPFTPESVDLKGEVSHVGDSAGCCEECNKVHTDTELFAYVDTDEASNDNACMCYEKKLYIKPVTSPSNFYAGVCGTSTCLTTPSRPDKLGNPSKGGKKCVFPFTFRRVTYYSCAPGSVANNLPEDSLWCATKVDEFGKLVLGEWGYCSQGCP